MKRINWKNISSWKTIGRVVVGSLVGIGLSSVLSGIGAIGTSAAIAISTGSIFLGELAVIVAGLGATAAVVKGAVSLVKGIIKRIKNPQAAKERRQARKLARQQKREQAKQLKQDKKNILAQAKENLKSMDPQLSKKEQKAYIKNLKKLLKEDKLEEAQNKVNQYAQSGEEQPQVVEEEVINNEEKEEKQEEKQEEPVVEQEEKQEEPVVTTKKAPKPLRAEVAEKSEENQTLYRAMIRKSITDVIANMTPAQAQYCLKVIMDEEKQILSTTREEDFTQAELQTLALSEKLNSKSMKKKLNVAELKETGDEVYASDEAALDQLKSAITPKAKKSSSRGK